MLPKTSLPVKDLVSYFQLYQQAQKPLTSCSDKGVLNLWWGSDHNTSIFPSWVGVWEQVHAQA